MPLYALELLDVLLFVQAAMQLLGRHSMAVFAFDEVRGQGCLIALQTMITSSCDEGSSLQPRCTQCLTCSLTGFWCVLHPTVLLRSMPSRPQPAAAHRGCSMSCQSSRIWWARLGEMG